MNIKKIAILSGVAAVTLAAVSPAQATWYRGQNGSSGSGGWTTGIGGSSAPIWGRGGWSSSGWGSSGWGSSGWGSSGWGSSGWGSSGWGSSGWGSSGWGSSSYGGTSGGSTGGNTSSTGGVPGGSSTGGTEITEPSNILMLGLGVAGLVAGRLAARRKRKDS